MTPLLTATRPRHSVAHLTPADLADRGYVVGRLVADCRVVGHRGCRVQGFHLCPDMRLGTVVAVTNGDDIEIAWDDGERRSESWLDLVSLPIEAR